MSIERSNTPSWVTKGSKPDPGSELQFFKKETKVMSDQPKDFSLVKFGHKYSSIKRHSNKKIEFDSKIDSMIKREKFEKHNKQNQKFVINIEDLDQKLSHQPACSKRSIENSKKNGTQKSEERIETGSLVPNGAMPVLAAFVRNSTRRSSTLQSPRKNNEDDYQLNHLHPTKPYDYFHTNEDGEEKRNFGKSNTGSDKRMPGTDNR
jgi:hypothetical protein